jgi:hypothetical protein
MFALILYAILGWHAAAAELLAELAIGLTIYGGGGGKPFRRSLRTFARRSLPRRSLLPGSA